MIISIEEILQTHDSQKRVYLAISHSTRRINIFIIEFKIMRNDHLKPKEKMIK
jgi:hypothetical protein